jgi:hypothetical protein
MYGDEINSPDSPVLAAIFLPVGPVSCATAITGIGLNALGRAKRILPFLLLYWVAGALRTPGGQGGRQIVLDHPHCAGRGATSQGTQDRLRTRFPAQAG